MADKNTNETIEQKLASIQDRLNELASKIESNEVGDSDVSFEELAGRFKTHGTHSSISGIKDLNPYRSDNNDIPYHHNLVASCAAAPSFRRAIPLEQDGDDPTIRIKWSEQEKAFNIKVNVYGNISHNVKDTLSQKVPLEIAESSRCTCGSSLMLGEYEVLMNNGEYIFEAVYYCNICKNKKIIKEQRLSSKIKAFVSKLKRIEVSPKGIVLEKNDK